MPRKIRDRAHSTSTVARCDDQVNVILLGTFDLRRGDTSERLPKKAQALLAYLAVHSGRPTSRDQIATLLWGNTATEQARQSLRQCLVALRKALGAKASELIVGDTTSVMLRSSTDLTIDVTRFEMACRTSVLEDLERACVLYRGDFLSGLHIHWM